MRDLVSVIITTYNRPDLFWRSFKSVESQTYDNIEIIVVDDSDDKLNLPKNVIHLTGKPKGLSHARNRGMKAASGKFIAFLDDDDRWYPKKTRKQVEKMNEENLDLCTCDRMMVDGDETWIASTDVEGDVTAKLLRQNVIGPPSGVIVRNSIVEDFDESFELWEDREWYVRISQKGKVGTSSRPLLKYYLDTEDKMSGDIVKAQEAHKRLTKKHNHLVTSNNTHQAWYHRKIGRMHYENGNRILAIPRCIRSIVRNPTIWPTYRLLIRSVLGEKNYTKLEQL